VGGKNTNSQTTPIRVGTKVQTLIPGIDRYKDRDLFLAPRSQGDKTSTKFLPFNLSNPKRVGKMIRIPYFTNLDKRRMIFNFPVIDYFGVIKPQVFARVTMTHQCFILSLIETCFYRLKRCSDFKRVSSHTLYECAMIYVMTFNDSILNRFRQMAIHHPTKLSSFVYYCVLNKLPKHKQVYLSACCKALSRRSRGHRSDFGGKGRKYETLVDSIGSSGPLEFTRNNTRIMKDTLKLFGASISPHINRFPETLLSVF
jgi:hypothetical protein